MKAAWIGTTACLHLEGTEAPRIVACWVADEYVSVSFDGGSVQSVSFRGTPQEIRLALAKGLAAIDRAVKEREAAERAELAVGDGRGPQTDWLTASERPRFAKDKEATDAG